MSRKKSTTPSRGPSDLEQARNDLFGHIHRCGVIRSTEEQQLEWMTDTIEYLAECYPSLKDEELESLKAIGLRFCRPVINAAAEGEAAEGEDATQDADEAGEEEIAASAA